MVEREADALPVIRQCQLLGLSRSGLYYQSHGDPQRRAFEHQLLNTTAQVLLKIIITPGR